MIDSPAIVAAFLDLYHRDVQDGAKRSLDEYRARFPGHEGAVERAWRQLEQLQTLSPGGSVGVGGALAPGERVGRYTIVRSLGEGGQGAVHLAEDPKLKRRVAVKVLSKLLSLTPERLERFRREAEVASRLDHPGICTVYETDTVGGLPFVVMRFVDGESLADRIAARAADAPPTRAEVMECVRLGEETARALQAAHDAGVIHRDVKPSNILVAKDGQPVVLDFGLASDLDDDAAALTQTGDVFGTPAYMSPEQIAPERGAVDARTDVYSLGVTLHELVTGVRPFDAATREGLFHAILRDAPPDPRRRTPAVPSDLVVVLRTAMEKEPDRRYSSARALADDLAAVSASRPIAAIAPSLTNRLYRWVRREPIKATLTVGLGAFLLLSAALGGFVVARQDALAEGERELRRRGVTEAVVEAYIGAPRGRLSLAQLQGLVDQDPSLAIARALMALSAVAANGGERALELLDDAPAESVGEDDRRALLRLRAAALDRLERSDEAEALRAGLGEPGGALEAFVRASLGGLEETASPAVTADFELAVLLADRPSQLYHLSLLRAYFLERRLDEAGQVANSVARLWPDSPTALFWVAMVVQTGDPERAVRLLRRAVDAKPDYVDAWMILAQCLERCADPNRATDAYEAGLRLAEEAGRSDLWRHHLVRGATLYAQRRYAEALAPLQLAVEQQPGSALSHRYLGNVLSRLGRHDMAIGSLEQALTLEGEDPKTRADAREEIERDLEQARVAAASAEESAKE